MNLIKLFPYILHHEKKKRKEATKGNDPAPESRTKNHSTQIQIINIAHKHRNTDLQLQSTNIVHKK